MEDGIASHALKRRPQIPESGRNMVFDSPDIYAEFFCDLDVGDAVVAAHPEDAAALWRHGLDRAVDKELKFAHGDICVDIVDQPVLTEHLGSDIASFDRPRMEKVHHGVSGHSENVGVQGFSHAGHGCPARYPERDLGWRP